MGLMDKERASICINFKDELHTAQSSSRNGSRRYSIACPRCGSTRPYRLGDGRRKCRVCGKRFSPPRPSIKIGTCKIRALARAFHHGEPATRVARRLKINVKTARNYYRQFRLFATDAAHYALRHVAQGSGTHTDLYVSTLVRFVRNARIRSYEDPVCDSRKEAV